MKRIFIFFYLFCNSYILFSEQTIEDAGFSGEHLLTYSAAAFNTAIGKTGVALKGNSFLSYWNPAGIYGVERPEVHFLRTELFSGTNWQFFSFARRIYKKLYLGLSYFSLSTEDIEQTDSFGNVLGYIGEKKYGYIFSLTLPANPFITLGLNLKIVYHSLAEFSDSGYGFDFGSNFKLPFRNIKAGLSWQNIMPPRYKLLNEFEKYPHTIRAGFDVPIIQKKLNFLFDVASIDIFSSKRVFRSYSGIKYKIFNILTLGFGYEKRGFSSGFSLNLKDISLNYAATFEDIDTIHHFDFVFKLGLTPEEAKIISAERRKRKIQGLSEEMNYYYFQKNYYKAKEKAEEILKLDSKNKEANEILTVSKNFIKEKEANTKFEDAERAFRIGNETLATELLNQAERILPGIKKKKEDEYYKLAEKALFDNEYDKCKEYLLKVIWLNPDNKEAIDMLKRVKKIKEMLK